MVVVSHLFLFLRKSFRGRFDSCESNLPLFGTIYFPTPPSFYDLYTAGAVSEMDLTFFGAMISELCAGMK